MSDDETPTTDKREAFVGDTARADVPSDYGADVPSTDKRAAAGDGVEIGVSSNQKVVKSALEKAEDTTQLESRNATRNVGGGITPPYPPERLGAMLEVNETHSACIRKKARYEVGFGLEVTTADHVDQEDVDEETDGEGDDQRDRVEDFWYGEDSRWQTSPQGADAATPPEVLELARQDYHAVGWCCLEILVQNDGTPNGLAHVPATTVRVRKQEKEREDGTTVVQAGRGYVQYKGGRTRYFGEAGDRYQDTPVFVGKEDGEVARGSAENLEGDKPANELIFVKNPSPIEPHYGVPDWIPAAKTIVADDAARDYNREILENMGIPYGLWVAKNGQLTDDSKETLENLMEELKDSNGRSAHIEALPQGPNRDPIEIEYQAVGAEMDEDMEWTEFRQWNEHQISKAHEVPPHLVGRLESANRSNSQEVIREFVEDVIKPEQHKFATRISEIIHKTALEAPDYVIEFDVHGADAPQRETEIAAKTVEAVGDVLTVNQALDLFGLEPRDDTLGEMLLSEVGGSDGPGDALMQRLEDMADEAVDGSVSELETESLIQAGAEADD